MICAAMLLAVAVLLGPAGARARVHAWAGDGVRTSIRQAVPVASDPLATASTLEVLAACLRSGMAVSTAAAATAPSAPPHLARILTRASDLLALGADPGSAWTDPAKGTDEHAEALLRLARRSAASGAALAQGVAELAGQVRDDASDSARAAAERAGVLIAGPLGLCYLPAFVCLGIVPVVAGLATDVLGSGVL